MEKTLFDSERKVMEVIWKEGDVTAKQISLTLRDTIGWNKNTTYTVIKKCIKKALSKAALIKQHRIVFGKRRSFGYAVSPFFRSLSREYFHKAIGNINLLSENFPLALSL